MPRSPGQAVCPSSIASAVLPAPKNCFSPCRASGRPSHTRSTTAWTSKRSRHWKSRRTMAGWNVSRESDRDVPLPFAPDSRHCSGAHLLLAVFETRYRPSRCYSTSTASTGTRPRQTSYRRSRRGASILRAWHGCRFCTRTGRGGISRLCSRIRRGLTSSSEPAIGWCCITTMAIIARANVPSSPKRRDR